MRTNRTATLFILALILITGTLLQSVRADSWPQWGGPSRDFTVKSDKHTNRGDMSVTSSDDVWDRETIRLSRSRARPIPGMMTAE